MKSNLIILITRNQLDTCHIRFVVCLALQNVLRVANDGFSYLIHCNMSNVLHIEIYVLFITAPFFCFVWVSSKKKQYHCEWVALIGLGSSIRHWEERNRVGSSRDQSSRVVIADYRAVYPRERIWLGARIPVILSFHRCLVTVVRDNANVS